MPKDPPKLVIIRHAEKTRDGGPHLSRRGAERARRLPARLARFLGDDDAELTLFAMVVPHRGGSQRCLETLAPTAAARSGMRIRRVRRSHTRRLGKELASSLRSASSSDADDVNGNVHVFCVCWEHKRIVELANAVLPASVRVTSWGLRPTATDPPHPGGGDCYDAIWVIDRDSFTVYRQHADDDEVDEVLSVSLKDTWSQPVESTSPLGGGPRGLAPL